MCLVSCVMSTKQRFVFTFNVVTCLKACFILVTCLGASLIFGDVLRRAFVIGDVYGLHTNRLPSFKH
jgi:hypothetical protein